jgi:hypothetical protein
MDIMYSNRSIPLYVKGCEKSYNHFSSPYKVVVLLIDIKINGTPLRSEGLKR